MDPIADGRVKVRVGETVFHTTKATLVESQLFASLFALPAPDDGEYYIDNDPDLFKHILRYLRTKNYPLFYNNSSGHDYPLYTALLQQAEFYQLPSLVTWLSERKFLQAVRRTTKHFSHTFVGEGQLAHMHAYWQRDEELTITRANYVKTKGFKCPAGKWEHDGKTGTTCALNRCDLERSDRDKHNRGTIVSLPSLEVEGLLIGHEILLERLRRQPVDSSNVIVAAMQNPPPYAPEDEETPLSTRPIQGGISDSGTGSRGVLGTLASMSGSSNGGGDGGAAAAASGGGGV